MTTSTLSTLLVNYGLFVVSYIYLYVETKLIFRTMRCYNIAFHNVRGEDANKGFSYYFFAFCLLVVHLFASFIMLPKFVYVFYFDRALMKKVFKSEKEIEGFTNAWKRADKTFEGNRKNNFYDSYKSKFYDSYKSDLN